MAGVKQKALENNLTLKNLAITWQMDLDEEKLEEVSRWRISIIAVMIGNKRWL